MKKKTKRKRYIIAMNCFFFSSFEFYSFCAVAQQFSCFLSLLAFNRTLSHSLGLFGKCEQRCLLTVLCINLLWLILLGECLVCFLFFFACHLKQSFDCECYFARLSFIRFFFFIHIKYSAMRVMRIHCMSLSMIRFIYSVILINVLDLDRQRARENHSSKFYSSFVGRIENSNNN